MLTAKDKAQSPSELARHVRALADKRAKQARQAADADARVRLNDVAAQYQALAQAIERQQQLPIPAPIRPGANQRA